MACTWGKSCLCSKTDLASLPTVKKTNPSGDAGLVSPGFARRLAAAIYDFILLLAILFAATAVILPLNRGQAFTSSQFYYPLYLFLVSAVFYVWFWTHGGQTLGLKAWHLIVLTDRQQPLSRRQALVRFLGACLSWACCGLGVLWMVFDKDRKTWHDRWSGTTVYLKTPNSRS
ncbi:MAG: hypothetical protein CTY34_06840 [Methylobacter sp.]|nr:MAG: hypothetical protein CTY34_06840 [Methylobacter sp.]